MLLVDDLKSTTSDFCFSLRTVLKKFKNILLLNIVELVKIIPQIFSKLKHKLLSTFER